MANFPGTSGALPGVYGPSDYYYAYQGSELRIGWQGGIFLDKGNWLDAAIALRIDLQKRLLKADSLDKNDFSVKLGHLIVDKNLDIRLDIPAEGAPYGPPEKNWRRGKPTDADSSIENFPTLKEHYDKIKNLKAFW